jgi:hypothetical protein
MNANKLIKLIVVTDGSRLRAFRFSARRQHGGLYFHCQEILDSQEADGSRLPDDADGGGAAECDWSARLEALAGQIEGLVVHEHPALWNLVAPPELVDRLRPMLCGDARHCLTRAVGDNMINDDLSQVVIRFPPVPCWSAPMQDGNGRHALGHQAAAC